MAEQPYGGKRRWKEEDRTVGIPDNDFMYTLDQIGFMLAWPIHKVVSKCHRRGVDYGACPPSELDCFNIGTDDDPDWRIANREFRRWLKNKGIVVWRR